MSKLSIKEVEKIAQLARLELTKKEKAQYSRELSGILGYVEKIQKIKTDKIAETSQVTGLENVYREDKVSDIWKTDKDPAKNTEKLLANAPEKKDGYWKVKQILE